MALSSAFLTRANWRSLMIDCACLPLLLTFLSSLHIDHLSCLALAWLLRRLKVIAWLIVSFSAPQFSLTPVVKGAFDASC